jgi:hypothetical protein
MIRTRVSRGILVLTVAAMLAGCGTFGRGGNAPNPGGRLRSEPVADLSNAEGAARELVRAYLAQTGTSADAAQAELLYAHPYYYRQFVVYPEGPDAFELEMLRTDSRTMPYTAEARYTKVRYATELHRNRDDALADDDFRRGTGTETMALQLKNGRWSRVSNLFVAEQLERREDGVWVPVQERAADSTATEEEAGMFRRLWNSVFGR